MKIINVQAGQDYELESGTQIEMERSNLFFNEWGEQSVPVELPFTDRNRALCGYPDLMANVKRPRADIECRIQDGAFCQPARQAILGARRDESISTSFYLGEGSFLAKLDETMVTDVFGDETVYGCNTVEKCMEFCLSLARGTSVESDRFAIFPVLLQGNKTDENGNTIFCWLNRYGYESSGEWYDYAKNDSTGYFYNATARTLQDGDNTTHIPAGCYIAPFLKANYVLKRVLAYFGYELQENFFTRTAPFPNMVLVHNCCDVLLAGRIYLSDLLPNCTCATLLNVFRKKFCCEFVTNESTGTVSIVLMNEVLDADPQTDLTPYVVGHISLETPESYKRVVLKSEEQTDSGLVNDNPENLITMKKDAKCIYLDTNHQLYARCCYLFKWQSGRIQNFRLLQRIHDQAMSYDSGESIDTEEISVPDCQITMRTAKYTEHTDLSIYNVPPYLYINECKFCHSRLVSRNGIEDEDASNTPTPVMLAFYGRVNAMPCGTVSAYIENGNSGTRIGNYSLTYVGPDGIYERFWKRMDNLYRNSLLTINAPMLLPATIKQNLNPHLPIVINNQKLLPDIIRYTLGEGEESQECTFRTVRLYQPISQAPDAKAYANYTSKTDEYEWVAYSSNTSVTQSEYEQGEIKGSLPVTLYPDAPSAKYDDGQEYYLQEFYEKSSSNHYNLIRVWLECHPTGYVPPEPEPDPEKPPTTQPGGGDEEGNGSDGGGDDYEEDPLA